MTIPITLGPGVQVGVTSLKIHATVEKLCTDTAPGYWVVVDDLPPNRRHVIHEEFLMHPDAVTTIEEREARKQQQIQNKTNLANGWTVDLTTRGFTMVRGVVRMRSTVANPDEPGRVVERPEALIEPVNTADVEVDWRAFMQLFRQKVASL